MARSVDTIDTQITAAVQADPVLSAANSPSRRAYWALWCYQMALAQNLEEQVNDLYVTQNEATVTKAPAANVAWVQGKIFAFQYDATTPQIVQLDSVTFAYSYPITDPLLQIITRCSVNRRIYNVVQIKTAKGTTPGPLTIDEVAAAQDYINTIGSAAANYQVISLDADRLFCNADVYYKGQYSPVITANTITSITNYLAGIDFNGLIVLSDLEAVIKSTTGVLDIVFKNVAARANATAFADKYYLVQNNTENARNWQTIAGYIIGEDTSGSTLADTLNFIPQ